MQVTILGHASLFIEAAGQRILLDPVLRTTSLLGSVVHQYPRALNLEAMPRPDLLVITHEHYDHFDPETLEKLPKDLPMVIPPDERLERDLRNIGFSTFTRLGDWEHAVFGGVRLTATPSEADVIELGLVVEAEGARFWHMSDAEPSEDTSARILAEHGPMDFVTVKYQPPDPLLNYVHNLSSSFDRSTVARWLEHACACRPKLAFPYASGLCLSEDHHWLNRYAYPISPEFARSVLAKRLAGIGEATVMKPGDVISIEDGRVRVDRQASAFVRQGAPDTVVRWEPIELEHLTGIASADKREELRGELTRLVANGEFSNWIAQHPKLLKPFMEWGIVCQFVVHLGGGERICFQADFSGPNPETRMGENDAAAYFMHISGGATRELLEGTNSSVEVIYQGRARIFERIIAVRDGKVEASDAKHMYGTFPDPFFCFVNARARMMRKTLEAAE
ncbi:MAG TPA: MBL fold metallo-hydrolase [Allosphingosinicella sp.]|jgi:hypothetical protein|nr:MBL fold metallo-hydrolase [Allosphingosinicella sp.]